MPAARRKSKCPLSFRDFALDPALMRGIASMGFEEPTSIQCQALPPALEGRDVLASAMTGSGKTAAFALPILQRLHGSPGRKGTRALVITPTRELAAQVHEHLTALGSHTNVKAATVFGGVSAEAQIRALRAGVDVVVATPGRLLDHLRKPWFKLDRLEVLVLDEADRMLDMGFLPDIRRVLAQLPRRRQTMLFSATLPPEIVDLARDLLSDPVRLDVERPAAPASGVTHAVYRVSDNLKKGLLVEILRGEVRTALVFTRTKHRADRLADGLDRAGIPCARIHGDRSQGQRDAALAAFKAGRVRVLVATDLAARGIDIEGLPHVINYDVPARAEDYVHRVGRTARAGRTGDALTFVTPADAVELSDIERMVGSPIELRRVEGFSFRLNRTGAAPAAGAADEGDAPRAAAGEVSPSRHRQRWGSRSQAASKWGRLGRSRSRRASRG
jgi:ATP-dependent RNA helicase RhlE